MAGFCKECGFKLPFKNTGVCTHCKNMKAEHFSNDKYTLFMGVLKKYAKQYSAGVR
jgi:hypothetical protein